MCAIYLMLIALPQDGMDYMYVLTCGWVQVQPSLATPRYQKAFSSSQTHVCVARMGVGYTDALLALGCVNDCGNIWLGRFVKVCVSQNTAEVCR